MNKMPNQSDNQELMSEIQQKYDEAVTKVRVIIERAANDDTYNYARIALDVGNDPLVAAILVIFMERSGGIETVDGIVTGFAYEKVLQDAPALSMVPQQRRLQ